MSEEAISDHISGLLGSQGQPELEDGGDQQDEYTGGDGADEATSQGDQDAGDQTGDQPRQPTKVPLAALQEERTRRQELQDQLKSRNDQMQAMEQRFSQMMQLVQQNQQNQQNQQYQQPEQAPAFIDDPEGHINALKAQFQAEVEQLRSFQSQTAQQQQAQQHLQNLGRMASAAEEQFRQSAPDYNDAAQFFATRKAAEYTALGADPVTIQHQLQRDYATLATVAANSGQNAAQMLYNLAKVMGYAPQTRGKPGQQQPAVKAPPASLSNMAGSPRAPDEEGGLTLETVANMTDAEFDKLFAKMSRGAVQRPKI